MSAERICGVVLAAGQSTRMGRNKLLIELGGRSVVRRAVATAASAGLDPPLVVLGHESDRVQAELCGLSFMPVLNPDHAHGMNTSLRAGIAAAGDADAALVLLADMPLVTAQMLRALVDAFRQKRAPLVVSTYGEVVAPPILYGRALFAELLALPDDACGKRVVKQHRAEAIELAWPSSVLADLDHPEDVERVKAHLEAS